MDYTWTRMKTHKNQLRIRNSQVLQYCFLFIFFFPAGVRLWSVLVQRSQWFWISAGSDRASCVRCLYNHLIFLSLFVENMSEWGLFFQGSPPLYLYALCPNASYCLPVGCLIVIGLTFLLVYCIKRQRCRPHCQTIPN